MSERQDPHKQYERRQLVWLSFSFVVIALMVAAVMLYGAVLAGWRPRR